MTSYQQQGLKDVQPYLKLIPNTEIRDWTLLALKAAPAYFWEIPSSSTGKYHPEWAVRPRGLFFHTVATMYLTSEFARTFGLDPLGTSIAVSAAALHDTLKYGMEYDVRYAHIHPYLPRPYYGSYRGGKGLDKDIANVVYDSIMRAVEAHMGSIENGEWNPARITPKTAIQQVVHLADYTASRKKFLFADIQIGGDDE